MPKNISDIFDDLSLEQTNELICNNDETIDRKTKKRIKKSTVKKLKREAQAGRNSLPNKINPRFIYPVACIILIMSFIFSFQFFTSDETNSEPSFVQSNLAEISENKTESRTDTSETVTEILPDPQVPQWYEQKELNCKTITYHNILKKLSTEITTQNSEVGLSANSIIGVADTDSEWVRVIPKSMGSNHSACSYVLYNIKTSEYVCVDLAIKRLIDKGVNIVRSDYKSGFYVVEAANLSSAYLVNINDKSVEELPVVPSKTLGYLWSKDFSVMFYLKQKSAGSEYCDLFSYKVSDRKTTQLTATKTGAFSPAELDKFSPGGNILHYTILNNNAELYTSYFYESNWELYNLKSGIITRGTGRVLHFVDERYVVVRRADGGHVYDTETGKEITENITLPEWAKYELKSSGVTISRGYRYSFKREPLFSDEKPLDIVADVAVFMQQEKYLYTYSDGYPYVMCFNVVTGESFETAISEQFLEQIKSIPDNFLPLYHMSLNTDKTKIILYFTTTDEKFISSIETNCIWDAFTKSDNLIDYMSYLESIDFKDYIFDYKIYAGKDFVYSCVTLKKDYGEAKYFVVEDYRTKKLAVLFDVNGNKGEEYYIYQQGVSHAIKALSPTASYDKTRSKFTDEEIFDVFDFSEYMN